MQFGETQKQTASQRTASKKYNEHKKKLTKNISIPNIIYNSTVFHVNCTVVSLYRLCSPLLTSHPLTALFLPIAEAKLVTVIDSHARINDTHLYCIHPRSIRHAP